mmetsp:Transcript_24367/g.64299  ORF Transcript_24367/g.64299 Transcript_24367/m.64299 type:complete len:256 (-) Transcript_24367:577-1344(-)
MVRLVVLITGNSLGIGMFCRSTILGFSFAGLLFSPEKFFALGSLNSLITGVFILGPDVELRPKTSANPVVSRLDLPRVDCDSPRGSPDSKFTDFPALLTKSSTFSYVCSSSAVVSMSRPPVRMFGSTKVTLGAAALLRFDRGSAAPISSRSSPTATTFAGCADSTRALKASHASMTSMVSAGSEPALCFVSSIWVTRADATLAVISRRMTAVPAMTFSAMMEEGAVWLRASKPSDFRAPFTINKAWGISARTAMG